MNKWYVVMRGCGKDVILGKDLTREEAQELYDESEFILSREDRGFVELRNAKDYPSVLLI